MLSCNIQLSNLFLSDDVIIIIIKTHKNKQTKNTNRKKVENYLMYIPEHPWHKASEKPVHERGILDGFSEH